MPALIFGVWNLIKGLVCLTKNLFCFLEVKYFDFTKKKIVFHFSFLVWNTYFDFTIFPPDNEIRGVDLGQGQESVIPALALPKDERPVALKVIHGNGNNVMKKMYWMENNQFKLQRANWNGSSVETLLDGLIKSEDHVDQGSNEAFDVDYTTGNIYVATSVSVNNIEKMSETTSNIIVFNQNMEYFQTVVHQTPRLIRGLGKKN